MKAPRILLIIVCALLFGKLRFHQSRQTLDSSLGESPADTGFPLSNITLQSDSHLLRESYPFQRTTQSHLSGIGRTKQTRLISSPIYGHIQVHFPQ